MRNCKEKVSQKKKKKNNFKEKGKNELIKTERETREIFNEETDNVKTINQVVYNDIIDIYVKLIYLKCCIHNIFITNFK